MTRIKYSVTYVKQLNHTKRFNSDYELNNLM